jgi:uroporphyrinogen-III synthase
MVIIVTRPQPQADEWVAALGALRAGPVAAVAFPLLRIAPLADDSAVVRALQALPQASAVMFVSAHAVAAFFAAAPVGHTWPAGLSAASTGPGTTAALLAHGVPRSAIVEPDGEAGRFDSEALWQQLKDQDWQGRRVLVVRGEDGRDWLAEQWRAAGAELQHLAAYRRLGPEADPTTLGVLRGLQAQGSVPVWLFSSSEAAAYLRPLAAAAGLGESPWHLHRALATHERIAETVRTLGFGQVALVVATPQAVADAAAAMPGTVGSAT